MVVIGVPAVLGAQMGARPSQPSRLSQPGGAEARRIERSLDLLPLRFEPNRGQAGAGAAFLARGRGFSAAFGENEAEIEIAGRAGRRAGLRIKLLQASEHAEVSGERRLPGTVNYFSGNDPGRWHTGVPTFGQLRYRGVYPGTDLIYYGNKGSLEFDFQLMPGASAKQIQMKFEGAQDIRVDEKGDLVVRVSDESIRFLRPVIYQPTQGGKPNKDGREMVRGGFRIFGKNTVGFAVERYDHARPLILDPILNYSTYIGSYAEATSIAVDASGEAYITGSTDTSFPTTQGSEQPGPISCYPENPCLFVAKFNSTGTALVYSTYLSGTRASGSVGGDSVAGIAVDANGDAFVVGATSSASFPVTAGAWQTKYPITAGQPPDSPIQTAGFLAELNSTGGSLIYSTYLGGSTLSYISAVALDASGDAYVTGGTLDTDFPTTPGAYKTTAASKPSDLSSAYIAEVNPAGTKLVYSTYLGGSGEDIGAAIAIDSMGAAYVAGSTTSTNFPVTSGAVQASREGSNLQAGFVTKINAAGSALVYSTYLGGSEMDGAAGIAVDASGDAYVTGSTNSADFPTTAGAFQTKIGYSYFNYPQTNAFVSEISGDGTALAYSTYLGGGISFAPLADEGDQATGIALDGQGMVYVTGMACTGDYPVTAGAFEPENLDGEYTGECTAFLTKLKPTANTPLVYSTYFGGTGDGDAGDDFYGEEANGLALDPAGNVYLAGFTLSVDFPVTDGVYETAFDGPSRGAFVTEFNGSEMRALPVPTVTLTSNESSVAYGKPVTFTATVQAAAGGSTPTGSVGFDFYEHESSDDQGLGLGFGPWTTVAMDGSGTATFTTSGLNWPQTQVNAFYLGDANNAPAMGTMTQTLIYTPTTVTVTASANNVPYGTAVVFTATVLDSYGNPAQGFVYFQLGNLGYGEQILDSTGTATWTNGTGGPPLPLGTDTIVVNFFPYVGEQRSSGTLVETFTPLGATPDPTLSPPGGTYTTAQQVTVGDANGQAEVYYTTDGSTPVPGVTPYSLPAGFTIEVDASETVQLVAAAPGYTASNVVSAAYTLVQDFTMDLSPQSMSLQAGGSGTATVSVYRQNGFSGAVSFSCSGAPAGVTCAFAPGSVAGAGTTTVTVAAAAATTGAMNAAPALGRPGSGPGSGPGGSRGVTLAAVAAACCLLGMRRRRGVWVLLCLACVVTGCGGGGSGGGSGQPPPPGPVTNAYTVNITGTSGSLAHSVPLSLTVTTN